MRKEDPGLRSRIMTIVASMGAKALSQVEGYLSDGDRDIRISAAIILGNSGLAQAFTALKKALERALMWKPLSPPPWQ